MKLVLLPGLDGTGDLFTPLLDELSMFQCEVIQLPLSGGQDYPSITASVREQLPSEEFILIAESFSGPIAATLAMENIRYLKSVIFVATFLSTPRKPLLMIAQHLPLKLLSTLPFSGFFIRELLLGHNTSNPLIDLFKDTIKALPRSLISHRIQSILSLNANKNRCELQVAYLQASSDKLVPANKALEFQRRFNNITIKTVKGSHLILQANPSECAVVISELVSVLTKRTKAKPAPLL